MARVNQVKDSGGKKLEEFKRRLGDKGVASILVGVQGKGAEETHNGENPDQETVGEIAGRHELGIGVPERSWLRAWVDENNPMIQDDLRAAMRAVLLGRLTREQAVEILGVKYVGLIQTRIANGILPPNAPSTIARKESSTPLIDTGQMRSAITYVLESMLGKSKA